MNAVIGMTGLLLDDDLTAEQRELAEVVRSSGDALLHVIDDILDYSKIEAGKLELEKEAVDLRECVESALEIVAPRAWEKRIELGCLIDEEAPAGIVGDAARLRQVLLNLLSNAIKFTEKGEVVVQVGAEPAGASAYRLELAVRDTGIGIPSDRMDRLFASFSQVDASTTRRYGGTGLGLAISKRLVELMGGTMWAESEEGSGSTFHVDLPVEATEATDSQGRARHAAAARRQAHSRGGRQRHEPRDRRAPRAIVGHGRRGAHVAPRGARPDRGRREVRRRRPRHGDAGDGRARPRTRDPAAPRQARASAGDADLARPAAPGSVLRSVLGAAGEACQGLPALQRSPAGARRAAPGAGGRRAGRGQAGDVVAADPPGRGQRREPEGRPPAPGPARLPRRRGGERPRGAGGTRAAALRRRAHGRTDARAGRPRCFAPDPRALAGGGPPAHHRDDGERDARGPPGLLRRRDGRLPCQADPSERAGGGAEPRPSARGHRHGERGGRRHQPRRERDREPERARRGGLPRGGDRHVPERRAGPHRSAPDDVRGGRHGGAAADGAHPEVERPDLRGGTLLGALPGPRGTSEARQLDGTAEVIDRIDREYAALEKTLTALGSTPAP